MCNYEFKSVFAPFFEGYLTMKTSMGFKAENFRYFFKELDLIFVKENVVNPLITKDLVANWRASRLNDSDRTLYDKWSVLAQFCRYMCHIGHPCHVPKMPRKKDWDFIPTVFTHKQMENIFTAADSLRLPYMISSCNIFSIPVLMRTLYATGMRISEAINLNNEDVDLAKSTITIKKSKNQRQRLIPISRSLVESLSQYLRNRENLPLKKLSDSKSPFLVSLNGSRLSKYVVGLWFRKILKICGIPFLGSHHGPRVHDIRHTFAVHTLMRQVKAGADIYCVMPVLSVYLGHKTFAGTEKYVRLTQEMFPDINFRLDELSSFIYPTLSTLLQNEAD